MTDEELAQHGVQIESTPKGIWFVSVRGWGRKIGTDEAEARAYAARLVRSGLRQP